MPGRASKKPFQNYNTRPGQKPELISRPGIEEPIAIPSLTQFVQFLQALRMTLEQKVIDETGLFYNQAKYP
jgi:hypothetical protein